MIAVLFDLAPRPFIDLAQWSALVGFLLPLLVAIIQRPGFSKKTRTFIGIAASAVAAFFTAWAQGKLSLAGWANSFIFVAITSWTTYLAVWVPAGAAAWIEAKTTPGAIVVKDATATPVATTTGAPPQ